VAVWAAGLTGPGRDLQDDREGVVRDFRFSFNVFGLTTRQAFVDTCREGERYGYDTIFAADHLGMPAPFPLLVAAAEATERMRVGVLVLNVAFWNPALLAREVATTDVLTDGRLEVGLGAGHMKWEFDEAGIGWQPFAARAERLSSTIADLGRFFHSDLEQLPDTVTPPRPVQRQGFGGSGPPLLVGGTGDRILRIAAEHADIVSVAGAYQVRGQPPGVIRSVRAAEADERMRFARNCAGPRADRIEWHLLVQSVTVTNDRRAAAEALAAQHRHWAAERNVTDPAAVLSADELLETPFHLIGTSDEIAGQLRASRDRWGFSYITVHAPFMPTFAPVIERLRAR
jgi:probable F420-dependent oxidoreductase